MRTRCRTKRVELSHPLSRRKGESDRKKVEFIYLSEYCGVMKVLIAIFAAAAILAISVLMTTTTQQALADRVGPNCEPDDQVGECDENRFTQGGLGEFYSKQGKESYYGSDITGQRFGQERSNAASSVPGIIGSNTAFYGSGECHGRVPDACE
jgi:hypothetical protein